MLGETRTLLLICNVVHALLPVSGLSFCNNLLTHELIMLPMPLSVLQTPLTSAHPAQIDDTLVDDVQHNSPAGFFPLLECTFQHHNSSAGSFPLLECTFQQHNSPAGSFPLLECTFQHMSHTSLETYTAWLALVGQTNMAQNKIGNLGWRKFTIPFAIAISGKACATLYVEMQLGGCYVNWSCLTCLLGTKNC